MLIRKAVFTEVAWAYSSFPGSCVLQEHKRTRVCMKCNPTPEVLVDSLSMGCSFAGVMAKLSFTALPWDGAQGKILGLEI